MREVTLKMFRVRAYNINRAMTHSFRVRAVNTVEAEHKVATHLRNNSSEYSNPAAHLIVAAKPAGSETFYE